METVEAKVMNPCAVCESLTDQEPQEYDGIDQIICDDCYGEFEYCEFCKINHFNENTCRHLFWSAATGDWCGCGSDRASWAYHKESFQKVLDKIGIEPATALLNSLKTHRYWHQFSGTIFGYDRLSAYWYPEESKRGEDFGHLFTDLFTEALFDEEEEALAIGVQWLASLWAGTSPSFNDEGLAKTTEADEMTAGWIEEWLASKPVLNAH